MKLTRTPEQESIVESAVYGDDLVVSAFAGSAKTTTLVMIAEEKHAQGETGLYVAYNKAIATEAQGRFPDSVDCRTMHSLAYRHTSKELLAKLKYPKILPRKLVDKYGFVGEFLQKPDGTRKFVSTGHKVSMINQTITKFCNSDDDEISNKHVRLIEWMYTPVAEGIDLRPLREEIVELSRRHWKEIINPESDVPITHDTYLKLFSMNPKQLPFSYILGDEWQDQSPVMLKIINAQKKVQKIVCGDDYQQIYQWRGSVNAMSISGGIEKYLSKSFRFGNNVAYLANLLLRHGGCDRELSGNNSDAGRIYIGNMEEEGIVPDAVICRTNTGVLKNIFKYYELYPKKTIGASCNVDDIRRFVQAFLDLQKGRTTTHNLLSGFDNYAELLEYAEENPEDSDISGMVKLILKLGPKYLLDAANRCVMVTQPDIMITTAHKAKGLEWDNVSIADDYGYDIGEMVDILPAELNLVYVAVTRAKKHIDIGGIADLINGLEYEQDVSFQNKLELAEKNPIAALSLEEQAEVIGMLREVENEQLDVVDAVSDSNPSPYRLDGPPELTTF